MTLPVFKFLTTTTAGEALGLSAHAVHRSCEKNPGFGIRLDKAFRIPAEHIERALLGETAEEIAANSSIKKAHRLR